MTQLEPVSSGEIRCDSFLPVEIPYHFFELKVNSFESKSQLIKKTIQKTKKEINK